jgi:LEA14-like dessication related protein
VVREGGVAFAVLLPEERVYERSVPLAAGSLWVLRTNVLAMRVLIDPVVTLDEVRFTRISLASLDLEVVICVENPNPPGIPMSELRFVVLCSAAQKDRLLASGTTGRVKIAGDDRAVLQVPVISQNAHLINALATFITKGEVQVTIRERRRSIFSFSAGRSCLRRPSR